MLSQDVLDDILPEDITQAALCWGGTLARPDPIGKTENLVYACHPGFALRLVSADHRPVKAIQAELEWVYHLRQKNLPVVEVLPSPHHQLWEFFTLGKKHLFYGTAFRWVDGERFDPEKTPHFWSNERLQNLGALMGQLHEDASPLPPAIRQLLHHRPTPLPAYLEIALQHWPKHIHSLKQSFEAVIETVQAKWQAEKRDAQKCGLIHGDLHAGNLIAQGNRLVLFDFDDAHRGWWSQDIAVAFYHLKKNFEALGQTFGSPEQAQVLAGYRNHRNLPPDFETDLAFFITWRSWLLLAFLLARFKTWANFPPLAQQAFNQMVERLSEA